METLKYFKASFNRVDEICVEKESETSVWVNGRRNAKHSSYEDYYKTMEEAVDRLIEIANNKIKVAKRSVEYAESELNSILKKYKQ